MARWKDSDLDIWEKEAQIDQLIIIEKSGTNKKASSKQKRDYVEDAVKALAFARKQEVERLKDEKKAALALVEEKEKNGKRCGETPKTSHIPRPRKRKPKKTGALDPEMRRRLSQTKARRGDVVVALMWHTGDDLDLRVTNPRGETICFDNKKDGCGGCCDVDLNTPGQANEAVENIYWPRGRALKGTYKVEVSMYRKRSARSTEFQVGIQTNDNVAMFEEEFEANVNERSVNRSLFVTEFEYKGPLKKSSSYLKPPPKAGWNSQHGAGNPLRAQLSGLARSGQSNEFDDLNRLHNAPRKEKYDPTRGRNGIQTARVRSNSLYSKRDRAHATSEVVVSSKTAPDHDGRVLAVTPRGKARPKTPTRKAHTPRRKEGGSGSGSGSASGGKVVGALKSPHSKSASLIPSKNDDYDYEEEFLASVEFPDNRLQIGDYYDNAPIKHERIYGTKGDDDEAPESEDLYTRPSVRTAYQLSRAEGEEARLPMHERSYAHEGEDWEKVEKMQNLRRGPDFIYDTYDQREAARPVGPSDRYFDAPADVYYELTAEERAMSATARARARAFTANSRPGSGGAIGERDGREYDHRDHRDQRITATPRHSSRSTHADRGHGSRSPHRSSATLTRSQSVGGRAGASHPSNHARSPHPRSPHSQHSPHRSDKRQPKTPRRREPELGWGHELVGELCVT